MSRHTSIFSSYVFLEIRGRLPERFLNICRNRGIPLYEVQSIVTSIGTVYTVTMKLKDFWRIRPIARKSKCILFVKKRLGIPFFLKKYRFRIAFICGGIYCLWLIYLLSSYLWSISVTGGFIHTEEELLEYLKEQHIVCGMRHKTIDCDKLEKQLRIDYPDIGWVSAELKGTKLLVRIAETGVAEPAPSKEVKSNICATSDGIVVSVICTRGTPMVCNGDVVKKGDVLISGIIPVLGDNDTLVNTHYVAAEGEVVLQTVKRYEYRFSDKKVIKTASGDKKKGISFYWKGKKIFSLIPSHNYEKYDIIQKDVSFFWNNYFHLPVLVKKLEVSEYKEQFSRYTESEIEQITAEALKQYEDYLIRNGTKIIRTSVATAKERGFIVSSGSLIIQSAAWEHVPITEE